MIVPSVKILLTVLLAASIAELGIRHAKGPSGLGKTLSSLEGLIRLKYFRSAIFCRLLQNILEVHMHDNLIDFEKYFQNCLTTFIWSTCVSNKSLLSLTIYWINTFQHTSIMLNASRIISFHTGAYIAQKVKEVLEF